MRSVFEAAKRIFFLCSKLEKFKKGYIFSNAWPWDGDFSWSVHLSVQDFGPENNILATLEQVSMRCGINNRVLPRKNYPSTKFTSFSPRG